MIRQRNWWEICILWPDQLADTNQRYTNWNKFSKLAIIPVFPVMHIRVRRGGGLEYLGEAGVGVNGRGIGMPGREGVEVPLEVRHGPGSSHLHPNSHYPRHHHHSERASSLSPSSEQLVWQWVHRLRSQERLHVTHSLRSCFTWGRLFSSLLTLLLKLLFIFLFYYY